MASAHARIFEVLLDGYDRIGTLLTGIHQYDLLFRRYSNAREALEDRFDAVLQFHEAALDELTRPGKYKPRAPLKGKRMQILLLASNTSFKDCSLIDLVL